MSDDTKRMTQRTSADTITAILDRLTAAERRTLHRLKTLERNWPKSLVLLVMDGEVTLARLDNDGNPISRHESYHPDAVVEIFSGIQSDEATW